VSPAAEPSRFDRRGELGEHTLDTAWAWRLQATVDLIRVVSGTIDSL
jgi:hypothetical protein